MVMIIASLALLVSATVWEGVTDVVSTGDLPGNFSVATNSFPKNSVVDIINLENGKMVRALVVSGLETKGLLATLSRNAANSIDLRGNSTCRIRITQPSDDIAFSRFKLGPIAAPPSSASEANVLSENNMSEGTGKTDRDEAQNYNTAVKPDSGADNAVVGAAVIGADDTNNKADYPIAAEAAAGTAVVMAAEKPAIKSAEPIAVKPKEPAAATAQTRTVQTPAATGTKTIPQDTVKASVQTSAEPAVEPAGGETAETMTGVRAAEVLPAEIILAEITPQNAVAESSAQTLVVTEPIDGIPVDTVMAESAYTTTDSVATAAVLPVVPAAVAQSVTPAAADNPPETKNAGNLGIIPSEERLPNTANRFVIAPEDRAPPLKTNNVSNASSSASPGMSDFSPFQVPLISRLEQGKCYVQIAAFQRAEHVEDEISRIGTTYPLAVQNIGSDTNPMFRILLGPLNQGESGAMLQRFKSIGYNDAFIRYN